ncbi:helix-turn-helix domain-containing protein [Kribbella sp. ALI-6-A]|nr:helix-turn-helix domain-containing protein [Kribbella sp. ALI-6-A]
MVPTFRRIDRERFAIKDDTWQRGIKELEALGLVRSEMGDVVVD